MSKGHLSRPPISEQHFKDLRRARSTPRLRDHDDKIKHHSDEQASHQSHHHYDGLHIQLAYNWSGPQWALMVESDDVIGFQLRAEDIKDSTSGLPVLRTGEEYASLGGQPK